MFSPTLLDGKSALVTASTACIGLKAAEIIVQAGARAVLINGRSEATGLKTAASLKALAPQTDVHFVAADITIGEEVASLFRIAREKMGRLDILIHTHTGPDAFPVVCQHALPLMKSGSGGAIVAVAADSGIERLARSLAQDEARHGIRVNTIAARAGLASPETVAPLIVFLSSPLAQHISGQVIGVDGGISRG